ncbi:MAG: SUMF1/EgtB/PvdO family nonheme iron enzyme [Planctomycetota bacterium]|nr:SUMF1/EgtB/PvdO family nonheme iron enzyme [Planctomycetota bacterium]
MTPVGRSAAGRRALGRLARAALICGSLACGVEQVADDDLARLERLAFVPAAECVVPGALPPGIDCSNPAPLLVDRFEVTRGEWLAWASTRPRALGSLLTERMEDWADGDLDRPATWMDLAEARAFAAGEDMRLPTAREWVRLAAGTRSQPWPWGTTAAASVANSMELGLRRLAPVGTFERGCTSGGVHDLIGNAAEWVEGCLGESARPDRTWVAGGSFLSHSRPLHAPEPQAPGGVAFCARSVDPAHRGRDLGLRLVVEAEEYLRSRAQAWSALDRADERLQAVGRRWGRPATTLLERLAAEPGAPEGLAALLAGARR